MHVDNVTHHGICATRTTPEFDHTGQNIGMYRSTSQNFGGLDAAEHIKQTIQQWYDEVKDFSPNNISPFQYQDRPPIGHYTQVAWAKTHRVSLKA